jgi:hypothetical protein
MRYGRCERLLSLSGLFCRMKATTSAVAPRQQVNMFLSHLITALQNGKTTRSSVSRLCDSNVEMAQDLALLDSYLGSPLLASQIPFQHWRGADDILAVR